MKGEKSMKKFNFIETAIGIFALVKSAETIEVMILNYKGHKKKEQSNEILTAMTTEFINLCSKTLSDINNERRKRAKKARKAAKKFRQSPYYPQYNAPFKVQEDK